MADDALRFLLFDDFHDVLFRQRLEIERVGRIEVGGNGFRIVVDDDGFFSGFAKRPGRVDGAVIKFNTLPDANRTAAEDDDASLSLRTHFVLLAVCRIVIRRLGFKFRRASVDHFVIGMNAQFLFEPRDFLHVFRQEMRNRRIGHLDALRRAQRFLREPFFAEAFLDLDDVFDFIKEEQINLRDAMNFFRIDAAPQGFGDDKETLVVDAVQEAADVVERLVIQLGEMNVALARFQAAERFDQRAFKRAVYRHDFARRFHLRPNLPVGQREFFKRPARHFQHDVIDGRLEARLRIFRDVIRNLVQTETERDFRRDFRNRIARRFGRERRRTADARIDFNHIVLIRASVQRVLDIATAFNLQIADDADGRRAEHLKLLVRQRLRRRDDNGIPGVDADGIDIFHGADDNAVVRPVAHDFKFDFFPSGHASFDQNLGNRREFQSARRNFFHFVTVMRDAAARAAERVRRANDDRVADAIRKFHGRFQFFENIRFRHRLRNFFHRFLEKFAVFRVLDGVERRTQKFHAVFFQDAGIGERDGHIETDLPAQRRQKRVRAFFLDDLRHKFRRDRLDVHAVGDVGIRHDCGRIAVHKDDFDAFFAKGAAGLGAGIVKFRRLPDDDGAAADDEDFFYIRIFHFANSSMACLNSVNK